MLSEEIRKKAEDKGLEMSPPWVEVVREINALFMGDPDVIVEYDEENVEAIVMVEDPIKADAIGKLLKQEFTFGNVTLKVKVIPANDDESPADLVRHMFAGNEAVSEIMTSDHLVGPETYVLFAPHVIQYYNDNLASPYGVTTTLMEDVARDVIEVSGISFATSMSEGDVESLLEGLSESLYE